MKSTVKFVPSSSKLGSCKRKMSLPYSKKRGSRRYTMKMGVLWILFPHLLHFLLWSSFLQRMSYFPELCSCKALTKVNGDGEGCPTWLFLHKCRQLLR